MQRPQYYNPILDKIRQDCLSRSVSGVKGIGIFYRDIDTDNSRDITFDEFKSGLIEFNIGITLEDATEIFRQFDHNNSGAINYDEFMYNLRPPMNINRMNLIRKAFQQLDRFNNGKVTVEDLKAIYSCKKNPKYLNGEWTEDQCLAHFLDHFEIDQHRDGTVTLEEFINYYSGVSAYIDSDAHFDIIIRQAWKL